jgi:hypothetical protein
VDHRAQPKRWGLRQWLSGVTSLASNDVWAVGSSWRSVVLPLTVQDSCRLDAARLSGNALFLKKPVQRCRLRFRIVENVKVT